MDYPRTLCLSTTSSPESIILIMAPLFYHDPNRNSISANALDHQSIKKENKSDCIVDVISNRVVAACSESGNGVLGGVDARQPLSSFRSDIEIIRQIPKLTVDISHQSSSRKDDATKNTTTPVLCSHHRDEKEMLKVGQKRNTRISFESHPFGQNNKRKTRISFEVHPFLVFDDESEEKELHTGRTATPSTSVS